MTSTYTPRYTALMVATADLCDQHGDAVQVLDARLGDYGGVPAFAGTVATLRVRGDNALVRAALETQGNGRVLVIDGGGSLRSALVGGNLGALAAANGWAGIVVWGAVRDVDELRRCPVGIRALGSCPRKSAKHGAGERDVPVGFGSLTIAPGDWLAADADGIIVAERALA